MTVPLTSKLYNQTTIGEDVPLISRMYHQTTMGEDCTFNFENVSSNNGLHMVWIKYTIG